MVCRCRCVSLLCTCLCVRVCGVIVVDARVREHRPIGSLLVDRFIRSTILLLLSGNKTYSVVGVKNRRFTI